MTMSTESTQIESNYEELQLCNSDNIYQTLQKKIEQSHQIGHTITEEDSSITRSHYNSSKQKYRNACFIATALTATRLLCVTLGMAIMYVAVTLFYSEIHISPINNSNNITSHNNKFQNSTHFSSTEIISEVENVSTNPITIPFNDSQIRSSSINVPQQEFQNESDYVLHLQRYVWKVAKTRLL